MLEIVESETEKADVQRRFKTAIHAALPAQGSHKIGFPGPGETREHKIRSAGAESLYYAYSPPDDDVSIPRYWNSFGIFRPNAGVQQIVVEINIPSQFNDGRVAGFFARDPHDGKIYVMHDGGIGGGRKGIGKEAFLDYLGRNPEMVHHGRTVRTGLRISAIDDPNLSALLWDFVKEVNAFKRAATRTFLEPSSGLPPKPASMKFENYFDEFWGRKQGDRRSKRIDYTSYHGLIVAALKRNREKSLKAKQQIGKNRLIDLGVWDNGTLCEVYEVKSSIGRQSLYTAIGQLMTHGWRSSIAKFLVIPEEIDLADDALDVLAHLGISIRRFAIEGRGVSAGVKLIAY